MIEAAFVGASSSIPLVLNIAANLIAFLSLLAAINGLLGWYGGLLDYPQLSFEVTKISDRILVYMLQCYCYAYLYFTITCIQI